MGYIVLAAVAGLVTGFTAKRLHDERKNREFIFWIRKREDR